MAPEKARRGAADSGAVPIVRKAQRRSLAPTGLAHATHRIAANTGWAHRSSAKAAPFVHYSSTASPRQTNAAARQLQFASRRQAYLCVICCSA